MTASRPGRTGPPPCHVSQEEAARQAIFTGTKAHLRQRTAGSPPLMATTRAGCRRGVLPGRYKVSRLAYIYSYKVKVTRLALLQGQPPVYQGQPLRLAPPCPSSPLAFLALFASPTVCLPPSLPPTLATSPLHPLRLSIRYPHSLQPSLSPTFSPPLSPPLPCSDPF